MTLDFSGDTPLYLGMYEWELHRFFRDKVAGAKLALDLGGHAGYDALMLAANCPGRVITFEPDAEMVPVLHANVEQNPGLRERIEVRDLAVVANGGPGTTTLDAISAEIGAPDFIKIDIDGGEHDALRGGIETLRERRPHLIVETHSRELEDSCGELLVDCGYRPIVKHNRKIWREYRAGAQHNRWLLAEGSRRLG
jgi:methyltransferase FkbM-like protein